MEEKPKEESDMEKQLKNLMKEVAMLKGAQHPGNLGFGDLGKIPMAQYPEKFKAPDFTKYNSTGDPYTHPIIFVGELGAYDASDK